MRLKSYLIWFTVIAIALGGFLFDFLFIFAGIIIVVYYVYHIAMFYKEENPIQQDTMICPRCMVPVDKVEGICPQCGEEL